jgi:predicted ATPase
MSRAEFARAEEAFDNCLASAAKLPADTWIKEHGEAPPLVARQYKGFICAVRGRLDEALRHTRSAIESADKVGHPISQAFACAIHAHVLLMRRDYAECIDVAKGTAQLSATHGFVFWSAHTEIHQGVAIANLEGSESGLALAERGLKNWTDNGAELHVPTWSASIAEAALSLGRLERAGELIAHARLISDRTGDYFARAELERLYGRLLLVTGNRSDGQSSLERALALARSQGAGLFALRAALDLAETFIGDFDSDRARDVLAPVLETYREHRDGADCRAALALLAKASTGQS